MSRSLQHYARSDAPWCTDGRATQVCGWEYLRDFDVGGISFSKTGRVCSRTGCGGALRNNLLDWEDALPEQEFQVAEDALRQSDLCICMGTSLRIRPASELPLLTVKNGGKLVLVNLQKTPKDRHAHLRIQAPVDDVLKGVMAVLGLPVPIFTRSLPVLFVARCHALSETSQREQGQGMKREVVEGAGPCRAPASVAVKAEAGATTTSQEDAKHVSGGHFPMNGDGAAACKAEDKSDEGARAVGCEAGGKRQGHGRAEGGCEQDDPVLWEVTLMSPVGRKCPLPLIERVTWRCGNGVQGKEPAGGIVGHAQEEGANPLLSVLPLSSPCSGATRPGRLSAEIFMTDTCTFSSKCLEVRKLAPCPNPCTKILSLVCRVLHNSLACACSGMVCDCSCAWRRL